MNGISTSTRFKQHYPSTVSEMMRNIIAPDEYYINNRFLVLLPDKYLPSGGSGGSTGGIRKKIAVNCTTASVPGVNFSVTERRESGQTFKLPYDYTTQNLNLTFRCSDSFVERKYFEYWFSDIFDPVYRSYKYFKGNNPMSADEGYAKNFDLVLLSNIGTAERLPMEIMHVKIFDAFPVNLSPIQVSYDSSDTIATFDVEIAFLNYVASNRVNLADALPGDLAEAYANSLAGFTSLYPMAIPGIGDVSSVLGSILVSNPIGVIADSVSTFIGDILSDLISDVSNIV